MYVFYDGIRVLVSCTSAYHCYTHGTPPILLPSRVSGAAYIIITHVRRYFGPSDDVVFERSPPGHSGAVLA